jgi:hypothetical protein
MILREPGLATQLPNLIPQIYLFGKPPKENGLSLLIELWSLLPASF